MALQAAGQTDPPVGPGAAIVLTQNPGSDFVPSPATLPTGYVPLVLPPTALPQATALVLQQAGPSSIVLVGS